MFAGEEESHDDAKLKHKETDFAILNWSQPTNQSVHNAVWNEVKISSLYKDSSLKPQTNSQRFHISKKSLKKIFQFNFLVPFVKIK